MWIFLNKAMLSVVSHRSKPTMLLVRARVKGDIEAVFPDASVLVLDGADYRYRSEIDREVMAKVLQQQVEQIRYANFKNSVKDKQRHSWYSKVWQEGHLVQQLGGIGMGVGRTTPRPRPGGVGMRITLNDILGGGFANSAKKRSDPIS